MSVKEMVFCTNCGTQLPEKAYFCFNCGVRTPLGVEANIPLPYKAIASDLERQLEKAAANAAEEIKSAFNKAKGEIRKAVE